MKKLLILFAIFGLAMAQGGYGDETPDPEPYGEGEGEPEPEGEPNCFNDSHCMGGWCVHGFCHCKPNTYGDHCEHVSPLRCIQCDGFFHDSNACATGWDLSQTHDVQECAEDEHYCKTQLWFHDGIPWLKRHGCSKNCWQEENCSPDKEGVNCIACCDYDYCAGGEKYMLNGSEVITPSILVVSLVSMLSYMF